MIGLDKFVLGLLFLGIMLSVTLVILAQTEDQIVTIQDVDEDNASTYTFAYNASVDTQTGLDDIGGWIPLLVVVTMAGVVVLVVRSGFGGGGRA